MSSRLFPDLVINGEHIDHTIIAAETQNQAAPRGKPGIAWRKAANAVAIRTLLLQEARQRRISTEAQEISAGRFESEEEALIRGLLEETVKSQPPSDAAVRAEWAKNPSRFRSQPLWEVSHILCACNPLDAAENQKSKARADDLLARIERDPSSFVRIANDQSDCGSRSSGGALGQVGPGDTVPEFEAALIGLKSGEIVGAPILTRHGWHIIRMDAVALGEELPFEVVKQRISVAMEKADWARKAQAFIRERVGAAVITGADMRPI